MKRAVKKSAHYIDSNMKIYDNRGLMKFISRYSPAIIKLFDEMSIRFLTVEQYDNSIENIICNGDYKELEDKYLIYTHGKKKSKDCFTVIDNSCNECFMEDFHNIESAILYLNDGDKGFIDLDMLFSLDSQLTKIKSSLNEQ